MFSEIEAILLYPRGCLIVADALNCQQKTAEIIISGKGDYLLDAMCSLLEN